MIIDQLPEISAVQETDEIPVERGTTTYKSTLQKLKDLVASLLTKADIGLGNVANKDLSNVDNVRQYSAENPPPDPIKAKDVTVTMSANSGYVSASSGIDFSRMKGAILLYNDDVFYSPPVFAISTSGSVNLKLASTASTARTYTVRIFYI